MAKVKVVKITLNVNCDCGKKFVAEDCEPICPYCDKKHQVSIFAVPKKIKATISPVCKQSSRVQLLMPEIRQKPTIPQID